MNLSHMHLQMVGPLEDLAALAARVGHKPSLMLVPDMPEQRAFQVEGARTFSASKFLRSFGGVA